MPFLELKKPGQLLLQYYSYWWWQQWWMTTVLGSSSYSFNKIKIKFDNQKISTAFMKPKLLLMRRISVKLILTVCCFGMVMSIFNHFLNFKSCFLFHLQHQNFSSIFILQPFPKFQELLLIPQIYNIKISMSIFNHIPHVNTCFFNHTGTLNFNSRFLFHLHHHFTQKQLTLTHRILLKLISFEQCFHKNLFSKRLKSV